MSKANEIREGRIAEHSQRINTLLLDADGVLQTSSGRFISDIQSLCPNPSQSKAFIEDIFLAEKPCLTGHADFPTELEQVLAKWRVKTPTSSALELWHQIQPVADIFDAISKIRSQGIRVCLASNQQTHRAAIMSDGLGYRNYFDNLFFSYELGIAKPSSLFFKKILDRLGTTPKSTLFIDDHAKNVAGAMELGILGETYHIDDGFKRFTSILESYGVFVDSLEGSHP